MKKVIVAMSGGVDSSVAAALLKKAGLNVRGVFLKLADLSRFRKGEKRARKIAKILKIPFLVLDLRKEFKNFRIYNIWIEVKKGHYGLLGEFKQSTPRRARGRNLGPPSSRFEGLRRASRS